MKYLLTLFLSTIMFSQNLDVNNDFNNTLIRNSILTGNLSTNLSLNIKPLSSEYFKKVVKNQFKTILESKNKKIKIKTLGVDYFLEYNSLYPYKKNNGTMLPNRGYQHIISPGIFFQIGPLSIKLKPEHHYSENKTFEGFSYEHDPRIWSIRYRLWNKIDMPERHGFKRHNQTTLGQSYFRLNWKKLSLGFSTENLWWGPSIRNSIMMSNNAQGFKHITFNTIEPIETFIGNFEWQIITGRLDSSGYTPPRTDIEYAGSKLYIPKINQMSRTDDWRYLQGYIISFSPKWIDGLSLGLIRWVQMYSALIEGKYVWMKGKPTYFPAFQNLFRNNDKYVDYEGQTNQAAGIFFKWLWKESNAEFYVELHHNDSKQNFRDLFLDSKHSRASTFGLQKVFKISNDNFVFTFERTQMEQSASRLVRNASSWYEHSMVFDGFTHRGEVLGSFIGPGSNSNYLSINRIKEKNILGLAIEIFENDNDFYYEAYASSGVGYGDFRRYWKDLNLHFNFKKSFNNFNLSTNLVYIRSLNYQWELNDLIEPYYHPGRDLNNFHFSFKLTYFGNW